jgi:hypothetical protein
MSRNGIVEIKDCFSTIEIEQAAAQVRAFVAEARNDYVVHDDETGMDGIVLSTLSRSNELRGLCAAVLANAKRSDDGAKPKQVLRCLTGLKGVDQSGYFHFDSYAITAIVPILMPEVGPAGDLIVFPRARRPRTNYLINVAQKGLLDLPVTQAILGRASGGARAQRIRMNPGAIYLLDGECTLHANEACDPSQIRATLVLHFAETHTDHWLKRRQIRRRKLT